MNPKMLILAVTAGLLATSLAAAPLQKKVLIVGIDGTRPDALAVARTPNLDALKSNGCFSDRAITHPVTHSAACWTSMFTGVWGDKHGVNDPGNSFAGNRLDLYPSFIKRLETAHSAWNTIVFARWSPLLTVVPDADVKQSFGSDAAITDETCRRLTNSNPDVFYMILLDVDSAGHRWGWEPTTPEYINAIETADGRVGKIMHALTSRATYAQEDWLVILLSDHGKHDDVLEKSRLTFHLCTGPSTARGTIWPAPSIVDVCASVLTHMGVLIDPAWNLDARVEGLPLPPTRYGTNLIFNGDGEWNSGTNGYAPDRGIAWWWDPYSTTLARYGSSSAFPSASDPGPPGRGQNFFLGGTNALTLVSQTLDLADIAADVDDPGVRYQVSGWFGGKDAEEDSAILDLRFLNGVGTVLGTNSVGGVTASDRGSVTGLLERSATGSLPVGTRRVQVVLMARGVEGMNDGSADNLSLVLTPKADPPFAIVSHGITASGWSVEIETRTNRVYALERSEDLQSWVELAGTAPGTGGALSLADTNAPGGQAFYRVRCRRP